METIITLISDIALTLTFVVAVVFGLREARSADRDRHERFGLDYLKTFQSREFAELMQYTLSKTLPEKIKDLQALPVTEQVIFIQLSQQMESLGLLVSGQSITIDLIDRTLGSYVSMAWKKYETLFNVIRKTDPYQGEYFQWLATQLETNQRDNPRQPFYLQGKVAT